MSFVSALKAVQSLAKVNDHVKTYRPKVNYSYNKLEGSIILDRERFRIAQINKLISFSKNQQYLRFVWKKFQIVLFSGEPSDRPCLISFANLITKNLSLLQCVNVVEEGVGWQTISANKSRINKWLNENKIKAFYSLVRNSSFHNGAR